MFDYSKSTIRPWAADLPASLGTDFCELIDVRWTVNGCDFLVHHQPDPKGAARIYKFHVEDPLSVLVQAEEGHVCSLWAQRDRDCPGVGGFVEVQNSPMIAAWLATDVVGDVWAKRTSHYVLGTNQGVAHVLSVEPLTFAEYTT